MTLSGKTQPYAVLGHPIGHSLSPVMHNASFQALGLDAVYLAFDVAPENLLEVLPAMQQMGFKGVNLTVPLKEVAFKGLTELDKSAQRLGAVNTVQFPEPGHIKGYNTDGIGFRDAIKEAFATGLSGKKIFVLGSGGAGRAVAITCAAEDAERLVLTDLDETRSSQLASEIETRHLAAGAVDVCPPHRDAWTAACREVDLVVQATPVGMKQDDESLIGPEAFTAGQMAFDLVYMYPETSFMRAARAGRARAANGLDMLLYQGAEAFTIWTGQKAAINVMREALRNEVYGPGQNCSC